MLAQVKRNTIMGLEVCVLEAQDDVYDDATWKPTNVDETSGEFVTDEDATSSDRGAESIEHVGQTLQSPDC